MRQRVMIAMMMACEPRLLIADEPTTALDVTIQSQIVELMKELRNSKGTSILLITHDIGLVAEMCDRVGVMYAGRVVEQASVEEIFANPLHDYTKGLMASSPRLDSERKSELPTIPGQVASPSDYVPGCRFCQRMGVVGETLQNRPPTREISPGHLVEDCPVCVRSSKVGEKDE
jgi:oligopeptide/dipeptide ABC transporter ATP-binding protein